MNKKSGSFVTALVAAVTLCSIFGATPAYASDDYVAKHKSQEEVDQYKNGVSGSTSYSFGLMTNPDGSITDASAQATVKSNYLYGRLDSEAEDEIIRSFKSAGLTEADFYDLKAQRQADPSGKPTLKLGWVKNNYGKWFYSEDGKYWATSKWVSIGDKWCFFDGSGQAVTGWRQISRAWYYFDSSYAMVSNTTIDGYRLGSDGILIQ